MKTVKIERLTITLIFLFSIMLTAYSQDLSKADGLNKQIKTEKNNITFIEIGSVRCIPCQKMQPIMKSIEENYSDQVKVIFYDVWTKEGKPYGDKYKIKLIPTQIFLDRNGKEYFRHEGFFKEEELVKILKQKFVKE